MTTGRNLRYGEAVLGLCVLGLGLFIALQTFRMKVAPIHAAVGPRLFPYLIGAGLIVLGILVLREAWFGRIAHAEGVELDWPPVGIIAAGLVLQMLLLERLGWILAGGLLFMVVARAFGSPRVHLDAALGLVLAGLIFVLFNYGLDLRLPAGILAPLLAPAG